MSTPSSTKRVYDALRNLPRVGLNNLKGLPGQSRPSKRIRGTLHGKTHGAGTKGANAHNTHPPLGFIGSKRTLLQYTVKKQDIYKDHHVKLHYVPLEMHKLQTMIDLKRIRTDQPIDVSELMRSGLFKLDPKALHGGFILESKGMEKLTTPMNIEVQWASEVAIAAIERVGGTITTAYYDPLSLEAAARPQEFFQTGQPIPKRMIPPHNLIEYYSNAQNRGYLADPDLVAEQRYLLSQKMGYSLANIEQSDNYQMLITRKDPRQVFYGLRPGWVVNLVDKCIVKPKDAKLIEYYQS